MSAKVADPPPALGKPLARVDGKLKVTGAAKYSAEFAPAQLAYGALIRSTIAKGRVTALDLSAAKSIPGVIDILTGENAVQFKAYPDDVTKKGAPGDSRLPLQDDEVHWSGQHLGVVIAETFEEATHAASLVRVTYESTLPVMAFEHEVAQETLLTPETFIGREKLQVKRGDVDAALSAAAARIDVVYSTPIENHNPIETNSTTAEWETSDRLLVHDSTRGIK